MRKAYLYQRFSSAAQFGNSSEDRQLDLQMEWLARNSKRAVLAESIIDKALSASKGDKGEHVAKGELGVFLAAIELGKIPEGSFLLIENISRITRLNLTSSQDLIRKFWDGGVTIVTVSDNMEYEPQDGNDPITMTRLFFEFDRYYKEIEWHKKKISYSYTKRFNDFVKDKKVPKMRRPFWLNAEGNLNEYADSVVRMFELYVEGKGQVLISRILKEEFPDYEPIKKMNPTTIVRWITSDIVMGIWKKVKMFDAAVTEDLYIAAKDAHIERYNKHKSSNPRRNWPLSGLFRCGHCIPSEKNQEHSGMTIQQSKNSLPVLRCSFRQRKANNEAVCAAKGEPTTFPYILAHWFFISIVQKKALMKYTSVNSDVELKKELKKNNIELAKLQRALDESSIEYRKLVNEGKSVTYVLRALSELETEVNKLKDKEKEILHQLKSLNKFIVSPEASGLIENLEKFNRTMHELGVKIYIKNRTLYYEGEKGFEYLGYSKSKKEYEYFDHIHLKMKCPVPLPPDLDMLLMEKGVSIDELSLGHADARYMMLMF